MRYTILITFLFSFSLDANSSGLKSFDLNKDGIKDRFEYYSNKKLIRVEEDRNNDSKIDFITVYNDSQFFQIEKQDTNFNGKFDRMILSQYLEKGKVKVQVKRDSNGDGEFDIEFYNITKSIQHQKGPVGNIDVPCKESVNHTFENDSFVSSALLISAELNAGFLETDFGYQIDKGCLNLLGNDFPNFLEDTKNKAIQCLDKLANSVTDSNTIVGASRNLKELNNLMANNNVSLVCSEHDYDWDGVAGHASTSPGDEIESLSIFHPYLSLNPSVQYSNSSSSSVDRNELAKTIFHEQLHNLGYRHNGETEEYPYTCETCCFGEFSDDNSIEKEVACKICTGDYKHSGTKEYLKDIVEYSELTQRESFGEKAAIYYIKENPKDVLGISYLARTSSANFNPVGYFLAQIIKKEIKIQSREIKENLKESTRYEPLEGKAAGEALARVNYELYYERDGIEALRVLNMNKEVIRDEFRTLKKKGGDSTSYANNIQKQTLSLLFEMSINGYGDKPGAELSDPDSVASKANSLYDFFIE